ncbi:fibronectin type III domain-containing protein [Actinomadura fulvescens]|uniref:Fibronectin type-III domain-containing protein n=1 Tax=Actinomadura fulvescens TaxID=46160 RepID=A0ABN3PQ72_9ACTN
MNLTRTVQAAAGADPRTRRRRTLIAVLALIALAVALLVALPSKARGIPAAPGMALTQLPFFMTAPVQDGFGDGGPGTATVNAAVSAKCNKGTKIYNPQWFQLPPQGLGPMIAASVAESHPAKGPVTVFPSGSAWVSTNTGEVVSCGEAPVTPTQALSLVAYYADPAAMAKCVPPDSPCHDATLRMYTTPTSGKVPPNDSFSQPTPIYAPSHTEAVDTTYGTPDGPLLADYKECRPEVVTPRQHNSVWWQFKPSTTGPVALSVEPLHIPPIQQFFPLNIAWVELTDTGPVLAPRSGPGCDAPVVLTAGRTYLVGVSVEDDAFSQARRITGGPVSLRVGAVPTPSAPFVAGVSTDEKARTATITWEPPATSGASPVTAYKVGLADLRTGEAKLVTLPATARSHTFTDLPAATAKGLVVSAVNVAGSGPQARRAAALIGNVITEGVAERSLPAW